MKKFSLNWKSSKKPAKQRKYRTKAPLHIKGKFLHAALSKELKQKHNTRNIRVVKGDKVRILVGDHKKKEGLVEKVDVKKSKIYVQGIMNSRRDGNKSPKAIEPSNVMIIELKTDDKKRFKNITKEKTAEKTAKKTETKKVEKKETTKQVKKSEEKQ